MKPCVKCGVADRYADGHCRPCAQSRARGRYHAEPEQARAEKAAWRAANPDYMADYNPRYYAARKGEIGAHVAAFRTANPERANAAILAARAKNPEKYKAIANAVAARRRSRTPPWLTPEHHKQIKAWYAIGAATGCHIDHIVPLNGKRVCGLHVPWNLQALPPIENMRKGNRLLQ